MQETGEAGGIVVLLAEVRDLRRQVAALEAELTRLKGLALLSPSRLRRMFTVWVYLVAAQTMVGLILAAGFLLLSGLSATAAPGGGAVAPARIEQAATATARPSATVRPGATKPATLTFEQRMATVIATRRRGPLQTQSARVTREAGLADCRRWDEVSLADVGQTVCVQGELFSVGLQEGVFYMMFGDEIGDFYALSYDWEYWEMQRGSCVVVEGEVQQLGSSPVIVVEYHDAVYHCAE